MRQGGKEEKEKENIVHTQAFKQFTPLVALTMLKRKVYANIAWIRYDACIL